MLNSLDLMPGLKTVVITNKMVVPVNEEKYIKSY